MGFLLALSKGIDEVTGLIGKLMAWLTLFLVLIGTFNVLTRYGFPLIRLAFGETVAHMLSGNRYLELQTYAFSLIFLLGAAYVFRKDGHVRVDILFSTLSNRAKAWIDIVATLLMLLPFCWLAIYTTAVNTTRNGRVVSSYLAKSWENLEMSSNPGGLPLYPLKTLIVIAFALLFVQGISEMIKNIAFLRGLPHSGSIYAPSETPVQTEIGEQA